MLEGKQVCRFVLLTILLMAFNSSCPAANLRYSWMLPRTVVDATISYTFVSCTEDGNNGATLQLKIVPTLVARAVADTWVGPRGPNLKDLQGFWQDRNISIETFSGSHILNSIGSQPVGEAGQIVGNIVGGIAKLVGVGLGLAESAAPPVKSKCGAANDLALKLDRAQQAIKALYSELASNLDDGTRKKKLEELQSLQASVSVLQADLTLTIKGTIDPGFSPLDINSGAVLKQLTNEAPRPIANSGLIASFNLSSEQLKKSRWYDMVENVSDDERSLLAVNVYLDFPNAYVPIAAQNGAYQQTRVSPDDQYRDPAYIPVLIWRGNKPAAEAARQPAIDEGSLGPVQLSPSQVMAFAQFGESQRLPLTTSAFGNLSWAVTFLENGEIIKASFSSKATGVAATNLFGNIASSTSSIAADRLTATSPSKEAAILQGQADVIYQANRLAKCRVDPSSCAGK
jgi:hypothetical protein